MNSRIGAIQVLRAIAANMVVVSHLSIIEVKYGAGYVILPPSEALGRYGVHLFFVISGFVIAMVASQHPSWPKFLWARITRIYPIYWIYTALVLCVAAVAPGMVNSSVVGTPSIWRSILLVPDVAGPWLAVGWSLVHEMYFYIVVTVLIAFRIPLAIGLVAWSIVLLLPIPVIGPVSAIVLSPLTFEFIAGAVIWLCLHKLGWLNFSAFNFRILERLGDASYSVYLSHVLVLSALGRLFAAQPWHSWLAESLFIVTCLIAANLWGWLSYRWLEAPLIKLARRHGPTEDRGDERQSADRLRQSS